MAIPLEQIVLELTTEAKGIRQGLDEVVARLRNAKRGAKDTADGFGGLERQFNKLVAAFSVGAIIDRAVAGIASIGRSAIASAGQIVDLSDKTGLSIEAVQVYGAVAKQSGSDVATYADAIFKLGVNASKGGDAFEATLGKLGVSYKHLRAVAPEEQFELLARKLKNVSNENDRNRSGVELFGKTWKEIAPGVVAGIDDIKRATEIASDGQVRVVDAASDAWDQFVTNSEAKLTSFLGNAVIGFQVLKGVIDDSTRSLPVSLQAALAVFQGAGFVGSFKSGLDPKVLTGELPKDLQDLLDKLFGIGGGKGGKGGKGCASGDDDKKAGAEADRLKKALDDLAESLSGNKLYDEMTLLADAVEQIGGTSGISADQIAGILTKIEAFKKAGFTLRPELKEIDDAFGGLEYAVMALNDPDVLQRSRDFLKSLHDTAVPMPELFISLADGVDQIADGFRRLVAFERATGTQSNPLAFLQAGRVPVSFAAPPKSTFENDAAVRYKVLKNYADLLEIVDVMTIQLGKDGSKSWKAISTGIGIAMKGLNDYAAAQKIQDGKDRSAAEAASIRSAAQAGMYAGFAYLFSKIAEARAEDAAFNEELAETNRQLAKLGINAQQIARLQLELGGRASPQRILELWQQSSDRITTLIGEMDTSLAMFGGHAPASLRPMIASLLESIRLTDAQRASLEALQGPPPWQKLQEAADRYGISIDNLGTQFNQLRSNSMFDQLFSDWTMFSDMGSDTGTVFAKMSTQVNEALNRARKFGLQVPEYMRPLLQGMLDAGQLIDENGNRLQDLSGINFSESIQSSLDGLKSVLEEIRDLLAFSGQRADDLLHPPGAAVARGRNIAVAAGERMLRLAGRGHGGGAYGQIVGDAIEPPSGRTQTVVRQYTGNVEIHVAGKRVGVALMEDIVQAFENNAGDGRPVGPTSRLAVALRRAA